LKKKQQFTGYGVPYCKGDFHRQSSSGCFRSGKSLIGSRTETPHNGDIREIIVLSTPAGTPFSQN
jgi:hypothetical protein